MATPALLATRFGPLPQPVMERIVTLHERYLRGAAGGRRATLQFVDAPDIDVRRRLLNDVDFTGANLAGSVLTGSHFERAALYCANLEGCDLRSANLRRADLRGARLAGAVLSGAVMDGADMRAAYISYPSGDDGLFVLRHGVNTAANPGPGGFGADFTNCAMRGVRLCATNLKGANFTGAVLEAADFNGAKLTQAIFKDTVMDGVDLEKLALSPEQLQGCVTGPSATALSRVAELLDRLQRAEDWTTTEGARGAPANLDDEDLRPLHGALHGRAFTALSARNTRAIHADFSGSSLQGAIFDGADLREANFERADLRGASFQNANLAHAHFAAANLAPLILQDGRPHPANFTGAITNRADFAGALRA
jgi:uncharacterized protein YjbI with pentapeptide repeats